MKFTMFIQQWCCCLVSLWQRLCLPQVYLLSPKRLDDCYVAGSVKSEGEAWLQRSWCFIKEAPSAGFFLFLCLSASVSISLYLSLCLCLYFSISVSLYLCFCFLSPSLCIFVCLSVSVSLYFVTKSEKTAMHMLERYPLSGAELVSLLILFFLLASRIVRKHFFIFPSAK